MTIRRLLLMLLFTSPLTYGTDFKKGVECYSKGDYQCALNEFKPLAEQGSAEAQYRLGLLYYTSDGVNRDWLKSLEWLEKAAEQGYAEAQNTLGLMYSGWGGKKDYFKAAELFEKAAEQGHAEAQLHIGSSYYNGYGVKQNKSIAKKWYGKACDNKLQSGCDLYRTLNEEGVY